jgi:predicted phosphodiesterase
VLVQGAQVVSQAVIIIVTIGEERGVGIGTDNLSALNKEEKNTVIIIGHTGIDPERRRHIQVIVTNTQVIHIIEVVVLNVIDEY